MSESDLVPSADGLARIGIEIWRLGLRIEGGDPARVRDSHRRLLQAFIDIGGRLEDRAGEPFVDGMVAEILDQPPGIDPAGGTLVWEATVRPGVYLDERQVITPQVLLKEREAGSDAPETHD